MQIECQTTPDHQINPHPTYRNAMLFLSCCSPIPYRSIHDKLKDNNHVAESKAQSKFKSHPLRLILAAENLNSRYVDVSYLQSVSRAKEVDISR